MNDKQVAETATLILEEYGRLKLDDIAFFFRQCKLAKYGKLYDLNGVVFLDWLNNYWSEREETMQHLYEAKKRAEQAKKEAEREAAYNALSAEEKEKNQRKIDEIIQRIKKNLSP